MCLPGQAGNPRDKDTPIRNLALKTLLGYIPKDIDLYLYPPCMPAENLVADQKGGMLFSVTQTRAWVA
jgi:hypothetical protein